MMAATATTAPNANGGLVVISPPQVGGHPAPSNIRLTPLQPEQVQQPVHHGSGQSLAPSELFGARSGQLCYCRVHGTVAVAPGGAILPDTTGHLEHHLVHAGEIQPHFHHQTNPRQSLLTRQHSSPYSSGSGLSGYSEHMQEHPFSPLPLVRTPHNINPLQFHPTPGSVPPTQGPKIINVPSEGSPQPGSTPIIVRKPSASRRSSATSSNKEKPPSTPKQDPKPRRLTKEQEAIYENLRYCQQQLPASERLLVATNPTSTSKSATKERGATPAGSEQLLDINSNIGSTVRQRRRRQMQKRSQSKGGEDMIFSPPTTPRSHHHSRHLQHKSSNGRSVRTQHDARGGHKSEPSSPDKVRRPLPDRLYDTPSDLAPSQLFIGQAKVPPPSHPQPCLILETPTESRGVGMGNFTTSCCGVVGGGSKRGRNKGRRHRSHSYSELDASDGGGQSDEDIGHSDEAMKRNLLTTSRRSRKPKDTVADSEDHSAGSAITGNGTNGANVSDCVRNLRLWVNSVGDRVGRGTTAILDALPSVCLKEDYHVVMIGLDSAGKTTVLYRLKFDQYVNTVPTIGFNCEKVRGSVGKSKTFLVWDVGGQEKLRPLWKPYTRATDGIIFVVDSCDSEERLEEAKLELHRILRTPDNAEVPILVIANKQDLPTARSQDTLEKLLSVNEIKQPWHVESVCAVTGEGLEEALEALHKLIVKRRKIKKRIRNKTR